MNSLSRYFSDNIISFFIKFPYYLIFPQDHIHGETFEKGCFVFNSNFTSLKICFTAFGPFKFKLNKKKERLHNPLLLLEKQQSDFINLR